ncbi:MAG: hypothetical protein DMG40_24475 [Acidobacteria bacterium]|nr:MAG: hypothetical protein DMG40_24475 [Acidobacteriota bacterium]
MADKQGNWMPNAAGMHASKPLACNKIARPRKTPPNTAEIWDQELSILHLLARNFPRSAFLFNRLNICSTSMLLLPC